MQTKQPVPTNRRQLTLVDLNNLKQRLQTMTKLKGNNSMDLQTEIKSAIQSIEQKLEHIKLTQLHPPFLPKTVTKYRREHFLAIKQQFQKTTSNAQDKENQLRMKLITSFVVNFDSDFVDDYLQRLQEPYIRKIFNQNYSMNGIDFKKLNSDQKMKVQIQALLSNASQWLLQIETTQDLLERIEMYFNIRTPILFEKAKKEGIKEIKQRPFSESFYSFMRNFSSFTLRKSAKIIQHSFFTAVAPSAIMLTLAIIGGSATLPWQSEINGKMLVTPILAFTVPFVLQGLASTIQRAELIKRLEEQTLVLEQVSASIEKFNQQLQTTILLCCKAEEQEEYQKQKINLQKYVNLLNANLASMTQFNQQTMEQMRMRTEAYFMKYAQIKQDQWTVVVPAEQLQNYVKPKLG